MSTVNAVTVYTENLQGANLVVGNTSSNLTVIANSISISVGNVVVNSTTIKVVSPVSSTQNTTINSTSLSANTLRLNGTDYTGIIGDGPLVDYQVFTSTVAANYWYKPSWAQANDIVTIQMWGGGGGVASVNAAAIDLAGGGGGACVMVNKLVGELNAVCNVIVGSGGNFISYGANGSDGGNSVFWTNSSSSITAYGGKGGFANSTVAYGGPGGGIFGIGTIATGTSTGGSPLGGTAGIDSTFGGGGGSITKGVEAGASVYGGGGGGLGNVTSSVLTGGKSVYGGGGGGYQNTVATSVFGGNGGNGTIAATAPGGGGGGGFNAGARGEVRVWVTGQARVAQ